MLPAALKTTLQNTLTEIHHLPVTLLHVVPVYGGSINKAAKLETNAGLFFVKWNDAATYPGMFEAEVRGLKLLRDTSTLHIPEVISSGTAGTDGWLLQRFLLKTTPDAAARYEAGCALATLHKNSATHFGLDHSNYIGSLPQQNKQHETWAAFYAEERIIPQIRMAFDKQAIGKTIVKQAEQFCERIGEIFPEEKPALLHGDLWSGNFMHSTNGPAVFDPAVYFGHREMDLAMSRLFGGFDADFYAGYEAEFPAEQNAALRVDFCNLYPLLVHVNLFGGSYVQDVTGILKKFG